MRIVPGFYIDIMVLVLFNETQKGKIVVRLMNVLHYHNKNMSILGEAE